MSDLLRWLRMVADAYKSVGDEESADYGYQAANLIEQLQQRNAKLEQAITVAVERLKSGSNSVITVYDLEAALND